MRAVVLVEGTSDQIAVETLARRQGLDLVSSGVSVVAMDGARNIRKFLEHFGPQGLDVRVAGLCDEREERDFRRALEQTGFGTDLDAETMEALGFFVCHVDLEDELIRALGTLRVLQVVEAAGELDAFRTLQKQPAQQGRQVDAQLRRFFGSKSGRKARYAELLVEALDLAHVPGPLAGVLASV